MNKLFFNIVNRGDIFTYDFGSNDGSIQNGRRPAIVVQADYLNKNSTVTIIAPITTSIKKSNLRSHVYLGAKFGLGEESMILLEQIKVVNQDELFEYIGSVDDKSVLDSISDGLKYLFNIRTRRYVYSEVKVFCQSCVNRLMENNNLIIRRVDSYDKKAYRCQCCGKSGNRYFVMSKQFCQKCAEGNIHKD